MNTSWQSLEPTDLQGPSLVIKNSEPNDSNIINDSNDEDSFIMLQLKSNVRPISAPPPTSSMGVLGGSKLWANEPSTEEYPDLTSKRPWGKSSLFDPDISTHSSPDVGFMSSTTTSGVGSSGLLASMALSRPKSAAPQLIQSAPSLETSTTSSLYDELSALSLGSRRPASTGYIAPPSTSSPSSSVMESLGLMTSPTSSISNSNSNGGSVSVGSSRKPHSIMDLIHEDVPPNTQSPQGMKVHQQHPSSSASRHRSPSSPSSPYQSDATTTATTQSTQAPNTTNHNTGPPSYHPHQNNHVHGHAYQATATVLSSESAENLPYNTQGIQSATSRSHSHVHSNNPHNQAAAANGPHHPMILPYDPSVAAAVYNYTPDEQVQRQSENLASTTANRVTPHTIYMNQPTFGGYTTIQYSQPPHHHNPYHHPHHTGAPTMLHAHDPHSALPHQVLHPVQVHHPDPGTAAAAAAGPPLFYWNGSPPGPSTTVTILDASGRPTTVAMAPVPVTAATATSVPPTSSTLSANTSAPSLYSMHTSTSSSSRKPKKGDRLGRNGGAGGGRSMHPRNGGGNGVRGHRGSHHSKLGLDGSRHSESVGSTRSRGETLLDEFKASKGNWTSFDIEGHIVEFCQDQNGSRFIQQRLEMADETEKRLVLKEVLPCVRRLRNDVFGNYVVQKLLAHGTSDMKDQLKVTFRDEMLSLATKMYGCRVVQKALETLDDDDVFELISEYHGHVLICIHDQNGNHVIQKCVEVLSRRARAALERGEEEKFHAFYREIQFIVDCVTEDIIPLACHPYGCRVLQRILEHCTPEIKTFTMDQLLGCHRVLLDDQYGNYVIQHVLQYGRDIDRQSILNIVIESGLLNMCRQKFASNVVEKLLKYGTNDHRNEIVREMLETVEDNGQHGISGSSVALLLVRDAYANYVVQTTLDVVPEGREKSLLIDELNNHADQLRNYTFAKHIVTKLAEINCTG